jgi:hypothetical protein
MRVNRLRGYLREPGLLFPTHAVEGLVAVPSVAFGLGVSQVVHRVVGGEWTWWDGRLLVGVSGAAFYAACSGIYQLVRRR